MTDEETKTTVSETEGSSDGTQITEKHVPYDRFREVNTAKNKAEKRLAELEAAEAARQEEEAKKRGDYDKLIADLKPKAKRAEELEQTLQEYLDAELANIPEDKRDLVPEGDVTAKLRWIKQAIAKGLFAPPPRAPNLDAGAVGDSRQPIKLTPEQQRIAKKAGMSEEDYYKLLLKSQGA